MPITAEDVQRDFLDQSLDTVSTKKLARFSRPLPQGFENDYCQNLMDRFERDLTATPGFPAMIAGLDKGYCIATSSSPARVRRTLEFLGLTETIGTNVFTATQAARGKPAPDLYLFAAGTLAVMPQNCLVVEDSPAGIAAARAPGGGDAAIYRRRPHPWPTVPHGMV